MIQVYGIIKNSKHSFDDFGLWIVDKQIDPPTKKRITSSIPYMNGVYDFSQIYGETTYEERSLKYVFEIVEDTKEMLNIKKIEAVNWLMSDGKCYLYDDAIPGFNFSAECVDISFSEEGTRGKLTAKFTAYPFKISTFQDGHDIWDDFNFELDMVQDTKFDVEIIRNIQLYNNGAIGINPIIICSNDMEIIKGTTTFKFKAGESKSWSFKLDKGLNNLTIKGTGAIEFKWYKEVL